MKLFYSTLFLFMCLSLGYGQNYTLKTKLIYTNQTEDTGVVEDFRFNNYIPEAYSKDAASLISVSYGESDAYTVYELYKKNKFIKVNVGALDNKLSIDNSYNYLNSIVKDYYFYKTKEALKTSEKKTILGNTCQYYTLLPEEGASIVSLCIDEKNAINNASYFLPNENIKGLVLDIRQQYEYKGKMSFTLANIEKVNININFDYDKELQRLNEQIELAKAEAEAEAITEEPAAELAYNTLTTYDDPICSNTYQYSETENVAYFIRQYTSTLCNHMLDSDYDGKKNFDKKAILDFASRDIKSYTKNLSKAKLINKEEAKKLTSVLNKIMEDSKKFKLTKEFAEYESAYKNIDLNDISLAVELPDVKHLLNSIPKHCTNLKASIPSFENKELKNIVHNYTGQICDLYLYEIEDYHVDLKATFESIRKSVLELENIGKDLSDSDKQALKSFLNSLD